ncbi:MAG TPA: efflux transporter outer membrane subunit [Casimicrobiaceae bacterium]|nr:efflux transporter outer membrane subunit [Casimicrobiaceae bacterium]
MTDVRRLVLVIAAGLAACTVGPDYRKPAVDAPASFQYLPADVKDTANTEWWKAFGDPVLDALIDEALANNRNVKVATANVEAAAALFTQARSSLFPQVGYGVTAGRQRTSESGLRPEVAAALNNPASAYEAALSVSWELDLWGRIRRESEAARANLLATAEARRGVVLSLVAGVATNYLQLRGLDGQLEVAKKTLGVYAESVKLFELQFRYGQVSQMNVAQARSQYETAAAQIPQIETQIAQTEAALAILVGRNPGPIPRGKTIAELTPPAVPSGLPSSLLERRPDLLESEQQLVAANAQIGAAKALYYPRITLTGALGFASPELSDLFKGPSRIWSYAGQLAGPIFSFGAVSGQVAQAEAAQRAALESYQLAIQNAFADVDNALVANAKGREQVAAQERLVAALSDYTRLARLQYNGGYAPYSTVLQAEQSLFPAELNLVAYRTAQLNTSVSLYKSMGGGWVDLAAGNARLPEDPPAVREAVPTQPWF